jgi:hypothetical protein
MDFGTSYLKRTRIVILDTSVRHLNPSKATLLKRHGSNRRTPGLKRQGHPTATLAIRTDPNREIHNRQLTNRRRISNDQDWDNWITVDTTCRHNGDWELLQVTKSTTVTS